MNDYFHNEALDSFYQLAQLPIVNQWKEWRTLGHTHYKSIQEAGFRCYSQFEEDGIILYLMTMLGIENGICVEICCGDGRECMSTNLILNHGFQGFLFDGSRENVNYARTFFHLKKDNMAMTPVIRKAWITAENVNDHILAAGSPTEIDFLSLDVDGMDYWIWEAINCISPKICCFETHDWIPSQLSLTVPYQSNFDMNKSIEPGFRSVSLKAMQILSKKKGYTLLGAHRHGFNVFFIRNDLILPFHNEVSPEEIHNNPGTIRNQRTHWPLLKHLPWHFIEDI